MHSLQGEATAAGQRARPQAGSTSGAQEREQEVSSPHRGGQLWKSQTEPSSPRATLSEHVQCPPGLTLSQQVSPVGFLADCQANKSIIP